MISTTEGHFSQIRTGTMMSDNPVTLLEVSTEKKQSVQFLTPYEPIKITSNDEFETYGFSGTGNWNDP